VRVLVFHGYLLSGTGSNVYNARLAEALVGLGHEVHLFSQDRHPERQPFVDAIGVWEGGSLQVRGLRAPDGPAGCTVYRPNIGSLLPVYVPDRYEGIEARAFLDCSEREIAAYVRANVDAVCEVAQRVGPHVALANHLVMGPVILARALQGAIPYAVKVHGSALEYTVKRDPQRFLAFAREGVGGAKAILVGSRHTAESLWEALADPTLAQRTRLGPPGVDVQRFVPREPAQARRGMVELIGRLRASPAREHPLGGDAFARDPHAAATALEQVCVAGAGAAASAFEADVSAAGAGAWASTGMASPPLVAFVGKLIVSKGVDLLLAAWPLVLERHPDARLLIVGFGAYRSGLEQLMHALSAGDVERVRQIGLAGRALERDGGERTGAAPPRPLRHLLAFLDSLSGRSLDEYLSAARALPTRVAFTGRLEHDELPDVLPACDALVVPSTFPEAFGMVAAEAAACGVPPVSARHSGLAEVSDVLVRSLPAEVGSWLSFSVDDRAVTAIAQQVLAWLGADRKLRAEAQARLVEVVRERWSWEGVARGVIAAAQGDLRALDVPR
jgi:glycosyltransferase involved in cell wall biosynthesis